jgi:hypothetical protein
MVPLLTLRDLTSKTYRVACNFVTGKLLYNHDNMMLIFDNAVVIQTYELRFSKNKSAEALDIQCWHDDSITAVITIRYKKELPTLLALIADRGERVE